MSFKKIYKFEKLISKTNNIRDCIQIAVAYYVYFDLPKIKNLSRVDKKNYIIDILAILCIALKEKIELNNIKQSINKNNLKLIEYLNIIINLKKELHSEYYISSTIKTIVQNTNSYIPIIEKEEGVYSGYIAIKKITKETTISDAMELFLFKKAHVDQKIEQEVYLVKLHQELIDIKNSYDIFFAIDDYSQPIDYKNTFIGVQLIQNTIRFCDIVNKRKKIVYKKPINLVKSLFAYGMLGDKDINLTNILIQDYYDCCVFYICDPQILFANNNTLLSKANTSLDTMNLYKDFIMDFDDKIKSNLLNNLNVLFTKQFLILKNYIIEEELGKLTSNDREMFASKALQILDKTLGQNIIYNFLEKMTNDEIWQELLDIKNNIDYSKMEDVKNIFKDHKVENYAIQTCNMSIPTNEYHEIVIKNIRAFHDMVEKITTTDEKEMIDIVSS